MMHIHWRRPAGPVYGAYAMAWNGAWGWRDYRCRCGRMWTREERKVEPVWREIPTQRDVPGAPPR
jgi:hypothetical protein